LSNLIDQFDENYDGGIGLRDSIIDIIETRNVDVPEARKVSDDAVFSVAERALTASAALATDVQHFNVIREVTNFVTFASEGNISETVAKHTDLLPVNHPNSTAAHEFSSLELRQLRAEWIASDPRITDENARAIVAAVYGSNPNSLDFHYNMIRLSSVRDQIPSDLRIRPILAFGDPYAGKNSFWHRKMRAEGQRRDEEGQFAEMGGGARLYVKMPMGNIISVVGKIAGIPENDPKGIDLEITDVPGITPGIYTVPSDMTKFFKAILPAEAIEKSSPVGPGLGVNFIDIADMIRKDLPTSWYTTESAAGAALLSTNVKPAQNYATGDGYRLAMYNGVTEALENRVAEARDKFGATVLNTKGTDTLEGDKPVYELISTKRGQEEVVGYAQDWSGVQQMTTAEDTNYPDAENEPIEEVAQPQVVAELPEVQEEVLEEDETEDDTELPGFNPIQSLPRTWRQTEQPNTFLSVDGLYVAEYGDLSVGTESVDTLDIETGERYVGDAPLITPGTMNIYSNRTGHYIASVFSWDSVERFTRSYEEDEDLPIVDRMAAGDVADKAPVDKDSLLPERKKFLEPLNEDIAAKIEKAAQTKNVLNAGGYEAKLGVEGVGEGVILSEIQNSGFYMSLDKDLLRRKGLPEAVDLWDEMHDYPQEFTVKDLATLYYNLYHGGLADVNPKGSLIYPQQREKIRRAIANLSNYKVPPAEYANLQAKIDQFRFAPTYEGSSFLAQINAVLNNYRGSNVKRGLTFKDVKKVLGSEVIVSDAIVGENGVPQEILRIEENPDKPDSLGIYFKGDSEGVAGGFIRVKKDEPVSVYRGSGVLPTEENLRRDAELKSGKASVSETPATETPILTGDGPDPKITEGKKDPKDVSNPLSDKIKNRLKFLAFYAIVDDAFLVDRLYEIANNLDNYGFKEVQDTLNRASAIAIQRTAEEGVTGSPDQRKFLKTLIRDRNVPEDKIQESLNDLAGMHKYSQSKMNEKIAQYKLYRAKPKAVDGAETTDITETIDITAIEIAEGRGLDDIPESEYAPLGTDLVGTKAPTKSIMVKAKQVIDNYDISPAALRYFMKNHRKMPINEWYDFNALWGQEKLEKFVPKVFTQAIPEKEGGPSAKQLASVERSLAKGAFPKALSDFLLQNYKTKDKRWFAKLIDVTRRYEEDFDLLVFEYAMRNGLDLTDLKRPSNFIVPDSYAPLDANVGADFPAEDLQKLRNKSSNKFLPTLVERHGLDPWWTPIIEALSSAAENLDDNLGTNEEQQAALRAKLARQEAAKATRIDIDAVVKQLREMLKKSNRELNSDGKRFVQQAIEELSSLRGALDGRRKNIMQQSPAEFDRRVKLIGTALANIPTASYSYGKIRNPKEKTLRNLEDAASIVVSDLVGAYTAGQDMEDSPIVDRKIDINSPKPNMKRFTPPAFAGEALEPLRNMSDWEQVRDFISKLVLYVFDFETTGIFDVDAPEIKNDPIQLAIAKAFNFAIQEQYNSYINPESQLSQFTMNTIGDGTGKKVTKEFLQDQKSKLNAMQDFLDMVPEGAVLVGHNGFMFDMEVLNRTLLESGLPQYKFGGFIDTFGLSKYVMPRWSASTPNAPFRLSDFPSQGKYGVQVPSDSLEALVTYFGLSNNGRHEADADVVSTLEILGKILDFAAEGKSDKGRTFDFEGSKNGWSDSEYATASEEYKNQVADYLLGRKLFDYAMFVNNILDKNRQSADSNSAEASNQILSSLEEIASRRVVERPEDRTSTMPASRVVSELGAGSYVLNVLTNQIGRSYGSTGEGLVLVEFPAAEYLSSGRTTLQKVKPSILYNATEAIVSKNGMALDLGMTVTHSSLGDNEAGTFSGFNGIGVGIIKNGEKIYKVPVNEISVLPYAGVPVSEKENKDTALDLVDELLASKALSRDFANAVKSSIKSDSYPRVALNNLISMLVNSREQQNIVKANKDTPEALPTAEQSASSSAGPIVDAKKKTPKLVTEKYDKTVLNLSLVNRYMPKVQLTSELENILKAALSDNRPDLIVNALAGTGKTTMLEVLAYVYAAMNPDKNLLYMVFGKENQEEAEARLDGVKNIAARTLHSVAMGVKPNQELRRKYDAIPKQLGDSEGMTIRYSAYDIAESFFLEDQYGDAIQEQYGVYLRGVDLARLAYDGLENWVNSADTEISRKHFKDFLNMLSLNPSWSPGARKFLTVGKDKDINDLDPLSLKVGELVGEDGVFIGKRYVRKDVDGRIVEIFNEGTTPVEIEGDDFSYSEEYIVDIPEDASRNEGVFIEQLALIAQDFWQDILSPHDPNKRQLVVREQHMVKNWSLGNIDLSSATVGPRGGVTSELGLPKIPNVIMLDEAQDLNPVFIDIMKRQKGNGIQFITVGDTNQSIFGFSGTANALNELVADAEFPLTVNRRSSPEILGPANDILKALGSLIFLQSAVNESGEIFEPNTMLLDDMFLITRTNAGILDATLDLETESFYDGKYFAITAGLKQRVSAHVDTMKYLYYDDLNNAKLRKLNEAAAALLVEAPKLKAAYEELKVAYRGIDPTTKEPILVRVDRTNPRAPIYTPMTTASEIREAKLELKNAIESLSKREDRSLTLTQIEDYMKLAGEVEATRSRIENAKPPVVRPADLIGATWGSIEAAIKAGTADEDTRVIFSLMSKLRGPADPEKGTKGRRLLPGPALIELSRRINDYRIVNNDYKMPEEVGLNGFFGNEIAYSVRDGNLVILPGGAKKPGSYRREGKKSPLFENAPLLESLGFERSTEMVPDRQETGKMYRAAEWIKAIDSTDEVSLKNEILAVYNALSGSDAAVQFLTSHTAKGLEQENVRLWKDWDPTYEPEEEGVAKAKPEKLEGETDEQQEERLAKEKQEKINKAINRQEVNGWYVSGTRAKRRIDFGGLANYITPEALKNASMLILRDENPDATEEELIEMGLKMGLTAEDFNKSNEQDADGPVVDKKVSPSGEDYYSKFNRDLMERKLSYIKSLKLSLKTPYMQRIVPFRFATDADVNGEIEMTNREIADLQANPNAKRQRDETSRLGLLQILAMLESGTGLTELSPEDRNRLFAYLGMSSLGSSGALDPDPTPKIRLALAELDNRLGIE
jgi:DNA polymerase III epsilon subunit-like protein